MQVTGIPEFDWNYPTPNNPPFRRKEPLKCDADGKCIKQLPPVTPETTFVRLEFDCKVQVEECKEWNETLVSISRQEGWRSMAVGKVVGRPESVILFIKWQDQAPEAIRNHGVPEEPSVFSFSTIHHLLASEPDLVSTCPTWSPSPYKDELIIIRGLPEALSPAVISGAYELSFVRSPCPNIGWEDYTGGRGAWALNEDSKVERRQVVMLSWVNREKEAQFKTSKQSCGNDMISIYNKFIGDPLREMQRKGAVVEQMDVDYQHWYPPPTQKAWMRPSFNRCSIQ